MKSSKPKSGYVYKRFYFVSFDKILSEAEATKRFQGAMGHESRKPFHGGSVSTNVSQYKIEEAILAYIFSIIYICE